MASRPPPPKGCQSWIDRAIECCHEYGYANTARWAAAELAELRAEIERLRAFYDSVTSTQSVTVPPSTTYTIFGAGDTTGHNPCDPADEYLKTARKAC